MRTTRITIGGLAAFILACGVGFAALKGQTLLWAQFVFTLALTVLLVATIGAVVSRPRAAWIGAAIFGWSYLVLALGPWFSDHVAPWLFSSGVIDEVFARYVGDDESRYAPPISLDPAQGPAVQWHPDPHYAYFARIAHSLAVILHAAAGGAIGHFLGRRSTGRAAEGGGA